MYEYLRQIFWWDGMKKDIAYFMACCDICNNVKAEHVYDGFSFNTAPVQTQVAAVEAALGTYYSPLINGMVDDVDATIAELGKVLDQAGMQDIIKELEKQAAEYVASK